MIAILDKPRFCGGSSAKLKRLRPGPLNSIRAVIGVLRKPTDFAADLLRLTRKCRPKTGAPLHEEVHFTPTRVQLSPN